MIFRGIKTFSEYSEMSTYAFIRHQNGAALLVSIGSTIAPIVGLVLRQC
jgi:hypothetical protein